MEGPRWRTVEAAQEACNDAKEGGAVQTSMLFTIGTALDRARQQGQSVDLLVEGAWVTGYVLATDGQGVVLQDGASQVIVRLDRIALVRVLAVDAEMVPDPDARPMPGPRQTALVSDVA